MERLSTSLEDGSIEKLRELAGGERKVGTYLSGVVSWLYENTTRLAGARRGVIVLPAGETEILAQRLAEVEIRVAQLEQQRGTLC